MQNAYRRTRSMNEEQTRLLAYAHFKHGKNAKEVEQLLGISYGKAIKYKKQLHEAEETNALNELFNMDDAALDMLLDSVKQGLAPVAEAFDMTEVLEGEVEELRGSVKGLAKLDQANQDAAIALANRIKQQALVASNTDSLVNLADALGKLQVAFYGNGAHGTGGGALPGLPGPQGYEKYLKD